MHRSHRGIGIHADLFRRMATVHGEIRVGSLILKGQPSRSVTVEAIRDQNQKEVQRGDQGGSMAARVTEKERREIEKGVRRQEPAFTGSHTLDQEISSIVPALDRSVTLSARGALLSDLTGSRGTVKGCVSSVAQTKMVGQASVLPRRKMVTRGKTRGPISFPRVTLKSCV